MTQFTLAPEHLEQIHQHALKEYPFECCGIVLGVPDSTEKDRLFECTNIQNKLHASDPVAHPRDARTAFQIEGKELIRINEEARREGLVTRLFYHSHPEHDAYFSDEDRQMALLWDEPAYPDARYLVISVYNRKIKEQALFEWNPETRDFEQRPFETSNIT